MLTCNILAACCLLQGLYDSIADASPLGVPIFVTETGSADKEGRHRRQIIEGHCSMVGDHII